MTDYRQCDQREEMAEEASRMAWICPYCGNELSEDVAHFRGCCGEMHCAYVEIPNETE